MPENYPILPDDKRPRWERTADSLLSDRAIRGYLLVGVIAASAGAVAAAVRGSVAVSAIMSGTALLWVATYAEWRGSD